MPYTERQKFDQWWVLIPMISMNLLFLTGIVLQLFLKIKFGHKPMSDTALVVFFFLLLSFCFLFLKIQLETRINSDGVYVRFFPFQLAEKFYPWSNIDKAYVRKYKPIMEYGGWGLRTGLSGKNKAFNISGNMGLQLVLLNGNKILIGTHNATELEEWLTEYKFLRS